MINEALNYLNLLDMIRELDLEKNDKDTIKEVLNYIAEELKKYVDFMKGED